MQCGLSVLGPQENFGWSLDFQRLSPCYREGGPFVSSVVCRHLSNLGDILECSRASFQKWTAVCNPSCHSFGKGQNMHVGDQDCRMLCKASQSCHIDRAFYTKDSQQDTNPKSNQSLVVPVFTYYLFPSYPALAKWTNGHNSYSIHYSMWACRHNCTHLVNERGFTCLLLRGKTSRTNGDTVNTETITRR